MQRKVINYYRNYQNCLATTILYCRPAFCTNPLLLFTTHYSILFAPPTPTFMSPFTSSPSIRPLVQKLEGDCRVVESQVWLFTAPSGWRSRPFVFCGSQQGIYPNDGCGCAKSSLGLRRGSSIVLGGLVALWQCGSGLLWPRRAAPPSNCGFLKAGVTCRKIEWRPPGGGGRWY